MSWDWDKQNDKFYIKEEFSLLLYSEEKNLFWTTETLKTFPSWDGVADITHSCDSGKLLTFLDDFTSCLFYMDSLQGTMVLLKS